MVGQKHASIIEKLVANGRWHIGQSEEGFVEIFAWRGENTEFLQITYDKSDIITSVYKYTT